MNDQVEPFRARICLVLLYFGRLPLYFPAFLRSCEANPDVDWLFLTDQAPPERELAGCISWISSSCKEINERASDLIQARVEKTAYGLSDMKPTFGALLGDHLKGYDYWGHCDCDAIFSNIRKHIDPWLARGPDVLTSRDNFHCGHFTLWKNSETVNNFFRQVPGYKDFLTNRDYRWFDEDVISPPIRRAKEAGTLDVQYASSLVVDWPQLERSPVGWHWERGELENRITGERPMYIHFMTWKRWMKSIDFGLEDRPDRFAIARRGIWHAGIPFFERVRQGIGYENLFHDALPVYRELHFRITGQNKARKNRK